MRKMLRLGEELADALVDLRGRSAVVAERLLQHDARDRRDQRLLRERLRQSARTGPAPVERKNTRTRSAWPRTAPRAARSQPRTVRRHARTEGARRTAAISSYRTRCRGAFRSWRAPARDIPRASAGCAPTPMMRDAAVDLPGAAAPIQGGQELAHRQVAGAAEQDEIERGERLHADPSWRAEFAATLTKERTPGKPIQRPAAAMRFQYADGSSVSGRCVPPADVKIRGTHATSPHSRIRLDITDRGLA